MSDYMDLAPVNSASSEQMDKLYVAAEAMLTERTKPHAD